MRSVLPEFYRPSDEQFRKLFEQATFVLDTNVLLNAYRTPTEGRELLLSTLERLKERLWIPHQVALEFQMNRLNVITDQMKMIEKRLAENKTSIDKIASGITQLELEKRGIDVDSAPLTESLRQTGGLVGDALEKAKAAQLGVTHDDPIRDRLDGIFGDRVGHASSVQAELDSAYADAKARFEAKIPPGFEDWHKGTGDKSTYHANGLRYERQFGDYLVWSQTLAHAKENGITHVIFVTSDIKDDWWLQRDGKTLGPLPELCAEAMRVGGVQCFWMYRVPEFLAHAAEHLKSVATPKALEEVREVENSAADASVWGKIASLAVLPSSAGASATLGRARSRAMALASFLRQQDGVVSVSLNRSAFSEVVATHKNGKSVGYVVEELPDDESAIASVPLGTRVVLEVVRNEFDEVGLFMLFPAPIEHGVAFRKVAESLPSVIQEARVDEVCYGYIEDGVFKSMFFHRP